MEENSKPAPPVPLSRWIARIMVAVILAEGIWGLLVSLTRDLIVPFLARQMGADPQSPLYLGKGDFDFPALFISLLELCLAGIVAALLYAWSTWEAKPRVVKKVIVRKAVPAPARSLSIAPEAASAAQAPTAPRAAEPPTPPKPAPITEPAAPSVAAVPQPQPVKAAATPPPAVKAPPAKPAKPKEVYYNIVGEPINPTEDDE